MHVFREMAGRYRVQDRSVWYYVVHQPGNTVHNRWVVLNAECDRIDAYPRQRDAIRAAKEYVTTATLAAWDAQQK